LNRFYRSTPALYEHDFAQEGFEWVDFYDWEKSVVSFLRKGDSAKEPVLVVCNFTPVPHHNYRAGVPGGGYWQEVLNSDAKEYGGSGHGNLGGVEATTLPFHGRSYSLNLTLPPLATVFFKNEGR